MPTKNLTAAQGVARDANTFQTACGVRVDVHDGLGPVAMTRCCNAAVTYRAITPGGRERLVCKACNRPKSSEWGAVGRVQIVEAVREAGCPIPEECADHTIWQATLARE